VPVADVVGRAEGGEPALVRLDDLVDARGGEHPVLRAEGGVVGEEAVDAGDVPFVHHEAVEDHEVLDRGPVLDPADPIFQREFSHGST
jgi:hypothetical protein